MTSSLPEPHLHASHTAIRNRLKRAGGHLQNVVGMVERGDGCLDIAMQLHAVERAIVAAKRALIQDHLQHCLDDALLHQPPSPGALAEFKEITKYL